MDTAVRVTYFDGTPGAITFDVGEAVTVHDPSGDMPGVVETVTPSHLYVRGPRLGGTDSRSWHWTISCYVVDQYVSKLDRRPAAERARDGETP